MVNGGEQKAYRLQPIGGCTRAFRPLNFHPKTVSATTRLPHRGARQNENVATRKLPLGPILRALIEAPTRCNAIWRLRTNTKRRPGQTWAASSCLFITSRKRGLSGSRRYATATIAEGSAANPRNHLHTYSSWLWICLRLQQRSRQRHRSGELWRNRV